jgi:hypothetical protein
VRARNLSHQSPLKFNQPMTSLRKRIFAFCITTITASGCISGPSLAPPEVPAVLRAPVDQSVYLEMLANGVQIYECVSKPSQPSIFEWVFRVPEAPLFDRSGNVIGTHYGGPTWKSADGSTVVGELKARDPGPITSAIPWLLLTNQSNSGNGVFSQTRSIQRVQTVGGIAPSVPCNAANAKQLARIPYTATYYFYRATSGDYMASDPYLNYFPIGGMG